MKMNVYIKDNDWELVCGICCSFLETGLEVGQLSESGAAHVNKPEWARRHAGKQGYAFRCESREKRRREEGPAD